MMYKKGINPIEVLLWSRYRNLREVLAAMKMIKSNIDIDFSDNDFVLQDTHLLDIEASEKEQDDANVKSSAIKKTGNDLKCPKADCKFIACLNQNGEKVNCLLHLLILLLDPMDSTSLTPVEIIKSHMALKHALKNFDVTQEVMEEWFI